MGLSCDLQSELRLPLGSCSQGTGAGQEGFFLGSGGSLEQQAKHVSRVPVLIFCVTFYFSCKVIEAPASQGWHLDVGSRASSMSLPGRTVLGLCPQLSPWHRRAPTFKLGALGDADGAQQQL